MTQNSRINLLQANALLGQIDTEKDQPTGLVVQANFMLLSVTAFGLVLIGTLTQLLPQEASGIPKPKHTHIGEKLGWTVRKSASLAARLGGMTAGSSIWLIGSCGFNNSGSGRNKRIVTNIFPLAQLDYILGRNMAATTFGPAPNQITPSRM